MDTKPVVQNFLGKAVRFYKASFEVEMTPRKTGSCNVTPPIESSRRNAYSTNRNFTFETWAIPFPDFCAAVGYDKKSVLDLINGSADVFADFYRIEQIPDIRGRRQKTILMAQEMADALAFKLSVSRIKDTETRARVIEFQRWVIFTFALIRRGKLKTTRDISVSFSCPPDYQNLLSLASGQDLARAVAAVADKEGTAPVTVYRKLRRLRGTNVINARGVPRKQRTV